MTPLSVSRYFTVNVLYDGIDGENNIAVHLDNQQDSFIYDDAGTNFSQPVESQARLFDGTTQVSSGMVWSIDSFVGVSCPSTAADDNSYAQSSYPTRAWISSTGLLTVNGVVSTDAWVKVKCTYGGSTYYDTLTLKKLVNADKYELVVTPTSVPYNPAISAASTAVVVNVYKTTADGTRTKLDDLPNSYSVAANGNATSHVIASGDWTFNTDNVNQTSYTILLLKNAQVLDSQTLPIVKAENGTSPYTVDSNNEMDSVACDVNGNPTSTQTVSATVYMFHGIEEEQFTAVVYQDAECTTAYANSSTPSGGLAVWWNASAATACTVNVKVTSDLTINGKDTFYIKMTSMTDATVFRVLSFIVNGVRPGAAGETAVIYSLVPSVTSVVQRKDMTFSTNYVSCTRQKNVGGVITTDVTDGNLYYSLDGSSSETECTNNQNINVQLFTQSITFIYRVNGVVVDRETIPMIIDGQDGVGVPGEDALACSLSNDADQFAAAYNDVVVAQTKTTKVTMYYGSSPQTLTALSAVLYYEDGTGIDPSVAYALADETTGIVTVYILAGTFTHDGLYADIAATCTIDGVSKSMTMRFTVSKVKGGDPGDPGAPGVSPELWQLALTHDALAFSRDADDTLTPSGITVYGYVTKTVGEVQTKYTTNQAGWRIYWGYDENTTAQDYDTIGSTFTFLNTDAASHTSVWFELRRSSDSYTNWVDRAVLPIVKDGIRGATGDSTYVAVTDNAMDSIACDKDGNPISTQTVTTNLKLWYGTQPASFSVDVYSDASLTQEITNSSTLSGGLAVWWLSGSRQENYVSVKMSSAYDFSAGKKDFYIKISYASTYQTLVFTVNAVKQGDDGNPGTSPTIYNLLPSDTQINVGRDSNDDYSPSTATLTCGYTKRTGDSAPVEVAEVTGRIDSAWCVYHRKRSRTDGWQTRYYRYDTYHSDSSQTYTLTDFNVATYDAVELIICSASATYFNVSSIGSYTVIDKQTVAVVSSGLKGEQGNTGPQGKMGRNLYFAGAWEDFVESGDYFEVTDYKAPYFSYVRDGVTQYWAFVGANGSYTQYTADTPGVGDNWSLMNSEFKYIITEGTIAKYGKFGGAVFNEDFMFSQYGYMLGYDNYHVQITDGSQYQNVNPDDMFGIKGLPEEEDSRLILYCEETAVQVQDTNWTDASNLTTISGTGKLTAGTYYSIKVYGSRNEESPGILNWKLSTSASSSAIASGTLDESSAMASSVTFLCQTSGTYKLFVKDGGGASVAYLGWVYLCPCEFVPATTINWVRGESAMNNLFLRAGFVRTIIDITTSNYTEYLFRRAGTTYVSFLRMATNCRFTSSWNSESGMPFMLWFPLWAELDDSEKDLVRGMAGQTFSIINNTNKTINVTGNLCSYYIESPYGISTSLSAGKVLLVTCDYRLAETRSGSTVTYGDEEVWWRIRLTGRSESI